MKSLFALSLGLLASLPSTSFASIPSIHSCKVAACVRPNGQHYCCNHEGSPVQDQEAATTVSCRTDSASMTFKNGLIEVSYFGHSRNNYDADYEVVHHMITRIGWTESLKKTTDRSTWHDMPQNLQLSFLAVPLRNELPGYILSGTEDHQVEFEIRDCHASN